MTRNKILALILGIICHISFATAISTMAYMIFYGMTRSIIEFEGSGKIFNFLLIIQFPLFHSFFLTNRGKQILTSPFPSELRADLFSTLFSTIASWQLIFVFIFWHSDSSVWFVPKGGLMILWFSLYLFSWLLLIRALQEAGMALQTGALGWLAVFKGQKPQYPKFPTTGLHGIIRQPIYASFALIIITAPIWSLDHAILAIIWVAYCFIGPRLKEKRYMCRYQEEYSLYMKHVPYILPVTLLHKIRVALVPGL